MLNLLTRFDQAAVFCSCFSCWDRTTLRLHYASNNHHKRRSTIHEPTHATAIRRTRPYQSTALPQAVLCTTNETQPTLPEAACSSQLAGTLVLGSSRQLHPANGDDAHDCFVVTPFGCLDHVEYMESPLRATSLLSNCYGPTTSATSDLAILLTVQNAKVIEALQARKTAGANQLPIQRGAPSFKTCEMTKLCDALKDVACHFMVMGCEEPDPPLYLSLTYHTTQHHQAHSS